MVNMVGTIKIKNIKKIIMFLSQWHFMISYSHGDEFFCFMLQNIDFIVHQIVFKYHFGMDLFHSTHSHISQGNS